MSNFTYVKEGFELLLEKLAPYICEKFEGKYGAKWWTTDTFLPYFYDPNDEKQLETLNRNDFIESLDIQKCLKLLNTRELNNVFAGSLAREDFTTAFLLKKLRNSNKYAHYTLRGRDFSYDEAFQALNSMYLLCIKIDAEQAKRISEIRDKIADIIRMTAKREGEIKLKIEKRYKSFYEELKRDIGIYIKSYERNETFYFINDGNDFYCIRKVEDRVEFINDLEDDIYHYDLARKIITTPNDDLENDPKNPQAQEKLIKYARRKFVNLSITVDEEPVLDYIRGDESITNRIIDLYKRKDFSLEKKDISKYNDPIDLVRYTQKQHSKGRAPDVRLWIRFPLPNKKTTVVVTKFYSYEILSVDTMTLAFRSKYPCDHFHHTCNFENFDSKSWKIKFTPIIPFHFPDIPESEYSHAITRGKHVLNEKMGLNLYDLLPGAGYMRRLGVTGEVKINDLNGEYMLGENKNLKSWLDAINKTDNGETIDEWLKKRIEEDS